MACEWLHVKPVSAGRVVDAMEAMCCNGEQWYQHFTLTTPSRDTNDLTIALGTGCTAQYAAVESE